MSRPATSGLTPREQAAFDHIAAVYDRTGHGPTIRELAEAIGCRSSCSAATLVARLVRKGVVHRTRYGYRSLRPTTALPPIEERDQLRAEVERLRAALEGRL